MCGARGPGAAGAPGAGGGGSGGPGHGAEGPPRGKMNKGWLELESDPGEEGAGRAGVWGGRVGPKRARLTTTCSFCRPTQASSPSWWKISVRVSPTRPIRAVEAHSCALAPQPGAARPDFFPSLIAGVKGVQVEEIYDLQSKCQG